MKRSSLNKIVDSSGFLLFVVMASSGLVMEFLLPPRSGQRLSVMGMTRHDWGDFHLIVAYLFLAVMALHLALHWRFVLEVVRGEKRTMSGWRFAFGAVSFLLIGLIAILPFIVGLDQR